LNSSGNFAIKASAFLTKNIFKVMRIFISILVAAIIQHCHGLHFEIIFWNLTINPEYGNFSWEGGEKNETIIVTTFKPIPNLFVSFCLSKNMRKNSCSVFLLILAKDI
jgi:hypothetical protein